VSFRPGTLPHQRGADAARRHPFFMIFHIHVMVLVDLGMPPSFVWIGRSAGAGQRRMSRS
jgi:hypothetical protein